ncbi:MAG: phosphatase PAP2 family protein [Verrucomicrobiota bacterium]
MTFLASILHDMEWVVPLRQESITPVFKFFTALGFTEFFFAALPILYWCWNKEAGSRVAVLTLLAGMLTIFLKDLFQDPRPPAELAVEGTRPDSYGLPSGHTMMAIVFWGSLAYESNRRWLLILACILVVCISSSRLYLGVHDLEDVLVGGGIGLLLLGALILKRQRFPRYCRDLLGSLLVLVVPGFLMVLYPQEGSSAGKLLLVTTFFAAWLIGNEVEKRSVRFANPAGWRRILIGVCGMVLLFLCALGLRTVLLAVSLPGDLPEAIGGLLIGLATTLWIPWILVKSKLLQRSNS